MQAKAGFGRAALGFCGPGRGTTHSANARQRPALRAVHGALSNVASESSPPARAPSLLLLEDLPCHLVAVDSYDLADEQWRRIEPLLPRHGRLSTRGDHNFINAVLWLMKTGSPSRDKKPYRHRHLVAIFFHALQSFRRIATRCEKTARNYLAIVHLACALQWLKQAA